MISFQNDGVDLPALDFGMISKWLVGIATKYNRKIGDMVYMFCSDERILQINRQFLEHDYYTDIITFDYTIGKKVGGDIYISLETVKTNSMQLEVSYDEELMRVIAHGLLHLCGLKDKTPEERINMEAAENQALGQLKKI